MPATLDRVFAEVADYSKTMGNLHHDFLDMVSRDTDRFLEKTDDLRNQMHWQGMAVIALTTLTASFAIAGALIPKTGTHSANVPTPDARLGANAGIADGLSNAVKKIAEKFSDNDFLRTTCKTASKFSNGLVPAAETYFRSTTTAIESQRSLLERVNLQDGQSKKSMFDQQVNQAQQAANRLLESKSKGG